MATSIFRDLNDREVQLRCEWDGWDWAAHEHPAFKDAFEELVAAGCDEEVLLGILKELQGCQDPTSSPDDLRRIRTALDQGRHALLRLCDDIQIGECI
jgi:hypothetical protein